MVKGIYHININVTNFERSLAFYELLGFRIVRDLGEVGNTYLERGLQMPQLRGRAALLQCGMTSGAHASTLLNGKIPNLKESRIRICGMLVWPVLPWLRTTCKNCVTRSKPQISRAWSFFLNHRCFLRKLARAESRSSVLPIRMAR